MVRTNISLAEKKNLSIMMFFLYYVYAGMFHGFLISHCDSSFAEGQKILEVDLPKKMVFSMLKQTKITATTGEGLI